MYKYFDNLYNICLFMYIRFHLREIFSIRISNLRAERNEELEAMLYAGNDISKIKFISGFTFNKTFKPKGLLFSH